MERKSTNIVPIWFVLDLHLKYTAEMHPSIYVYFVFCYHVIEVSCV